MVADMRRTILLAGVLPFVSAFLGGVLAFSVLAAPQVTAQSSQIQDVRASAFTVVSPEGTVLARLGPGPNGPGNLALNDAEGTRRLVMTGAGVLVAFDPDGTTPIFRAGRCFEHCVGGPSLNGVELGPGGSIGMIPLLP
jgi:hypothetical protein